MSLKYCACHEKSGQVIRSAAPVTQNHLSKPEDLMLQNATPLKKSAPWPPNISDEYVSCTALATRNGSLQILFKCPTPASAFETATKPSRCAHFWQGAESPCACHAVWHLNVQKWSEHVVLTFWKRALRHSGVHFFIISTAKGAPSMVCFVHFDIFWLENVLRATTACTFSSSQLPKVELPKAVWDRQFFTLLTWKCASRHNGVHFFVISTSKNAPRMVCFLRFDFEMCFAPQRRAIFHLIWPDGSAPAALASLLFDPPEPQIIVKYSESRLCYLFTHLHLLSSDSFSSLIFFLLLFSSLTLPTSAFPFVHIVGSLTSKLPSIIYPSH